ncbi:MAG: TIGR01212 family radical SAM protein [Deltaproteobacteria bacterium]|nr:TIGR01212 family radical SAM protein [Deltaproteobacteria bacterium]
MRNRPEVKRYRDYNSYLRGIFGERVQKISLDAGLSCPNRDGTISREGCFFCNGRGSGTGAFAAGRTSIEEQIESARNFLEKRYGARKFIAYFQSFSNTYAPPEQLKRLYDTALAPPGMVGLSVATRPDCINEAVLDLLASYKGRALTWLEMGLQSAHDETLRRINRGHDAACFERAVLAAHGHGIQVCAHVILGLPGETREMMRRTARYLAALPVQGVKIHLLYVVRDTPLAHMYRRGEFRCLEREEYADLVADFLERLPPRLVIQRLTGDPGPGELLAPAWALDKGANLEAIRRRLAERDTWQGRRYPGAEEMTGPGPGSQPSA